MRDRARRLALGVVLAGTLALAACQGSPGQATATTSRPTTAATTAATVAPGTPTTTSPTTAATTTTGKPSPTTTAPSAKPTARPTASTSPSGSPLAGMVAAAGAGARPSTGGARLKPTSSGPLDGRVIVVDPGHNGTYVASILTKQVPAGHGTTKACNSSGTASRTGVGEHAITWAVGVRLVGLLRAKGATVVLTRPSDTGVGPCVNERAAIANRAHADLVLSIHGDGNYSSSARGFHVIVSTTMDGGSGLESRSLTLAKRLVASMKSDTDLPPSNYIGGGTGLSLRSDIAGLNLLATSPGVMLEMGNVRQASDWGYLATAAGKNAVAKALLDAAVVALG